MKEMIKSGIKGKHANIRCQWDWKAVINKNSHILLTLDMPV